MFTASITNKTENTNGTLTVEVTFSDGVKTFTETTIPQDSDGLTYFINGRLKTLNFTSTTLPLGVYTPPIKIVPVIDPTTQARIDWFQKVNRLSRIKSFLLDTKVLTGTEKEVTDLVASVQAGYLPEYLATL